MTTNSLSIKAVFRLDPVDDIGKAIDQALQDAVENGDLIY